MRQAMLLKSQGYTALVSAEAGAFFAMNEDYTEACLLLVLLGCYILVLLRVVLGRWGLGARVFPLSRSLGVRPAACSFEGMQN